MNATSQIFLSVLEDGISDAIHIAAQELADSVDLQNGQTLTWLCSARVATDWVHVFFCETADDDEEFVLTRHAPDGLLLAAEGPFTSLALARGQAGPAPEGWIEA
jgi:hypothetical protein